MLPTSYVLYVSFENPVGDRGQGETALRSYARWAELDVVIRSLHGSTDVKSIRVCTDNGRVVRPLTHADMGYMPELMPKIL